MHFAFFILWLLSLCTGLLIDLKWIDKDYFSALPSLKLTSSFILVLAACYTIFKTSAAPRRIAVFIAVGMAFGFLGDCAMAGLFKFFPSPAIGGMLFFGIGHLAYIYGALLARRYFHIPANALWWLAILVWQVIGILIWVFIVDRSDQHLPLHIPALAYGALLAATAGVTSALAIQKRQFTCAALGAILFLFSDGVIAWEMFQSSTPLLRFLVWATYGPGQMLIVFGFAWVLVNRPKTAAQVS